MSDDQDPYRPLHTRLLGVLAEHRVDLVVIGGVGLQLRGWAEQTTDVDLSVDLADEGNRARLAGALEDLEAKPVLRDGTLAWETRLGRLEILEHADGIGGYAQWRTEASPVQLPGGGGEVLVGSARQIDVNKTTVGRAKDLDKLPGIRAAMIRNGQLAPEQAQGPVEPEPEPAEPALDPTEQLLGQRPEGLLEAQRWDGIATMLAEYRARHDLVDHADPLGPDGPGPHADERVRIKRFVELFHRPPERGIDR